MSNFYGHVMLGLRIHFLYFSQPNVSKICSFIHLCIHPSPFWASGEISQHSPLRCTHIFLKTSYDQQIFLSIKSRKSSLSKTCWFFIFYFPSFSPYLLSLSFFSFFLLLFFLDDVPKRKTLHSSRISNIIDNNDINTNATIQTKMYALYK